MFAQVFLLLSQKLEKFLEAKSQTQPLNLYLNLLVSLELSAELLCAI